MMADKLGGRSYQIHAPLFADSAAEREMLINMRSVADVFKRAREAEDRGCRHRFDPVGRLELLRPASVLEHRPRRHRALRCVLRIARPSARQPRQLCDYSLNRSLVSLTLAEFASIPRSIGMWPAARARQADPQRSCAAIISIPWSPTRRRVRAVLAWPAKEAT
jgi:hypothetical protein